MDKKKQDHFKTLLSTWQQKIVDENIEELHVNADDLADISDRASQEEEITIELQNMTRKRNLAHSISVALKKLENDEYGYCEKCATDISEKRLESNPIAPLCIDCQELVEIQEHNFDSQ
jgi:DnaK suppressor protein